MMKPRHSRLAGGSHSPTAHATVERSRRVDERFGRLPNHVCKEIRDRGRPCIVRVDSVAAVELRRKNARCLRVLEHLVNRRHVEVACGQYPIYCRSRFAETRPAELWVRARIARRQRRHHDVGTCAGDRCGGLEDPFGEDDPVVRIEYCSGTRRREVVDSDLHDYTVRACFQRVTGGSALQGRPDLVGGESIPGDTEVEDGVTVTGCEDTRESVHGAPVTCGDRVSQRNRERRGVRGENVDPAT